MCTLFATQLAGKTLHFTKNAHTVKDNAVIEPKGKMIDDNVELDTLFKKY